MIKILQKGGWVEWQRTYFDFGGGRVVYLDAHGQPEDKETYERLVASGAVGEVCTVHGCAKEPRIGLCCGQELCLDHFTNTCDCCGADYNSAGQRLAPREQWGEETGESLADILAIP